jgi:hypothetical protein
VSGAALLWPSLAGAATYTASDGSSLASAVQHADAQSGASTIQLGVATYAPTDTLTLQGDITIVGPTASGETITGDAEALGTDLFDVTAGSHVTFVNVSLDAAGYENEGAAIDDSGSVDLENSTLAGNDGPSLLVQVGASATVEDSTLSSGLEEGIVDDGSATLINSTVADNAVEGIDDSVGALTLVNSIVAGNGVHDCSASAGSVDHSLDSDGSCVAGSPAGVAAGLGPLRSNGGPTLTQALLPGSPAIDGADVSRCPAYDQRYAVRPAGRCDVGAYQTGTSPPVGAPSTSGAGSGTAGSGTAGASTGETGQPPAGGSAPSSKSRRVTGAAGRGTLRGARRRPISFTLDARVERPHGSLSYRDAGAAVWLRGASIATVVVNGARGAVTASGSAINAVSRRRVRFVATVTEQGRVRTLRVRLSTGYDGGGRLLTGTLADTTSSSG